MKKINLLSCLEQKISIGEDDKCKYKNCSLCFQSPVIHEIANNLYVAMTMSVILPANLIS
jgi:hypothetical protein